MFSLYVPCQQEYEELRKIRDTLKKENSVLTQRLAKLSEKCLELANENDYLEVNLILYIKIRYLFDLRKYLFN